MAKVKIIRDAKWPNMYRIKWLDGVISDMANLTRCNDAVARFKETTRRNQYDGVRKRPEPA
jgi:hypothetical protein